MTNSQCIEVAEKVWGWERDVRGIAPNTITYYGPETGTLKREDKIDQEVNSWQGFGRTVEAMAERGILFQGTTFAMQGSVGIKHIPIRVPDAVNLIRNLIEATHLAALEALNE